VLARLAARHNQVAAQAIEARCGVQGV